MDRRQGNTAKYCTLLSSTQLTQGKHRPETVWGDWNTWTTSTYPPASTAQPAPSYDAWVASVPGSIPFPVAPPPTSTQALPPVADEWEGGGSEQKRRLKEEAAKLVAKKLQKYSKEGVIDGKEEFKHICRKLTHKVAERETLESLKEKRTQEKVGKFIKAYIQDMDKSKSKKQKKLLQHKQRLLADPASKGSAEPPLSGKPGPVKHVYSFTPPNSPPPLN